jgi:hypothetical protein
VEEMKLTKEQRFDAKVDFSGDCWLWKGRRTKFGYGFFWEGKKDVYAHRFSWSRYNGEIPKGLFILHRCDNPPCVKPGHLSIGTPLDNVKDCWSKVRGRLDFKKGTEHYLAKLDPSAVIDIKTNYIFRKVTQKHFASKYGVSSVTIHHVLSSRNWKHLDEQAEEKK